MIKTGLIGHPLSHSLSAVMHNAAFEAAEIDGKYELIDIKPENIKETIERLKAEKYTGFNVTIPYKVNIKQILSMSDILTEYAGSTNTVVIKPNGMLYGYNTDVKGFISGIPEQDLEFLRGKKALILGNGGAARAVATGLGLNELAGIDFTVRHIEKAMEVKQTVNKYFPKTECNIKAGIQNLSDYSIIVNTTPLGMYGENVGKMPLTPQVLATADKTAIIYDIVYNPLETELIKNARRLKLKTLTGLDMLVFQAAKAFKIWTGVVPDIDIMKSAALKAI